MKKIALILISILIIAIVVGTNLLSITPLEKKLVVKFYDANNVVQIPFAFKLEQAYNYYSETTSGSSADMSYNKPRDWDQPTIITKMTAIIAEPIYWYDHTGLNWVYKLKSITNSTEFVITNQTAPVYGQNSYTPRAGATIFYYTKTEYFYGYVVFKASDLAKACDYVQSKVDEYNQKYANSWWKPESKFSINTRIENGVVINRYDGLVISIYINNKPSADPRNDYLQYLTIDRYVGLLQPFYNPNPTSTEPTTATTNLTEDQQQTLEQNGVLTNIQTVDVNNDIAQTTQELTTSGNFIIIGLALVAVAIVLFWLIKKRKE
jgi:hypothetical protein